MVGVFEGTVDFDPTDATDERTVVGDRNGFLVSLDPDGSYLSALTFGEGTERMVPRRIVLDAKGNQLIIGTFCGTADFDPGLSVDLHTSFPIGPAFSSDGFITKLGADGSYQWTRILGGRGFDRANQLALDAFGHVFVLGTFQYSADFDPGPGEEVHIAPEAFTLFLTKYGLDASYHWTRSFPIRDGGGIMPLALDTHGDVYVAGGYDGVIDFDPTNGVDIRSSTLGGGDTFLTKLTGEGSYEWTMTYEGLDSDFANRMLLDTDNNIFLGGGFRGTIDFDPTDAVDEHTGTANSNVYLVKLHPDLTYAWTRVYIGTGIRPFAIDHSGSIVATGSFRGIYTGGDPNAVDLSGHHFRG